MAILFLVFLDSATFYCFRLTSFKLLLAGQLATYEQLRLLMQYVTHCESSVFFRLLQYGKWATWRCLKEVEMKIIMTSDGGEQSGVYTSKNSFSLRHLVRLNRKLNSLLAFPLLLESILNSLKMFWSLTFHDLFSARQMMYFLLPGGNILLTDYFSRKITQTLAEKSVEVEERHARVLNLDKNSKNRNKLVYWKQVVEMYSKNVFQRWRYARSDNTSGNLS